MKVQKRTKRFYDTTRYDYPQIRVYHKKGIGKKGPRYLLKCGCCEEKLEFVPKYSYSLDASPRATE